MNVLAANYNAAIPGIVSSERQAGISVSMVDLFDAIGNAEPADLGDGVHPTNDEYAVLAQKWFAAITGQ